MNEPTIYGPPTTGAVAELEPPAVDLLFDDTAYVVDGQKPDKLIINFSGSIEFDAADPEGQRLFRALDLGYEPTMRVSGLVTGKAGSYKVNAQGEETVTGKATVTINTLYVPTPEELD